MGRVKISGHQKVEFLSSNRFFMSPSFVPILLEYFQLSEKEAGDAWSDLGVQVTAPLKVDDYQLFSVEPIEARYIRITFIKGHLREGKTDWNYSEAGNVSVGDLQVFIYNR